MGYRGGGGVLGTGGQGHGGMEGFIDQKEDFLVDAGPNG